MAIGRLFEVCERKSPSLENPRLRSDTGSRLLAIGNPRRAIIAIQIVMNRHRFDPNDRQGLAKAEQGFTAAVGTGPGQVSRIRSFDPNAEETVFFPRLVGG
jgi:hypothetical protein